MPDEKKELEQIKDAIKGLAEEVARLRSELRGHVEMYNQHIINLHNK